MSFTNEHPHLFLEKLIEACVYSKTSICCIRLSNLSYFHSSCIDLHSWQYDRRQCIEQLNIDTC
jgi:hypothetical protein